MGKERVGEEGRREAGKAGRKGNAGGKYRVMTGLGMQMGDQRTGRKGPSAGAAEHSCSAVHVHKGEATLPGTG